MIAIVCLDLNNGMFFNNRRQSMDKLLRKDMLQMTKGSKLWMTDYSREQFNHFHEQISISTGFFEEAEREDYCFIENCHLDENRIEKLIVYRWDKVYPSDFRVNLAHWNLVSSLEFPGYSHDKITKEVYEKNEK